MQIKFTLIIIVSFQTGIGAQKMYEIMFSKIFKEGCDISLCNISPTRFFNAKDQRQRWEWLYFLTYFVSFGLSMINSSQFTYSWVHIVEVKKEILKKGRTSIVFPIIWSRAKAQLRSRSFLSIKWRGLMRAKY